MSHRLGGQQVRPNQTKAVNGQNGKTLVMAGTIKGPLSCPENRTKKQSILGVKKKNRVKRKEKKIRKKTEKKKEEIEKRREIVQ